jgi:hypothetical protein
MKIPNVRVQSSITTQMDIGAKADKVADLAKGASDSFEGKSSVPASPALTKRPASTPGAQQLPGGAPGVPGRRPANELNPFDAKSIPTSRDRAKSGIQAELDAKGATLPMGMEHDARLASLKSEVESQIGNYTGPDDSKKVGDVAYNPNSSDPVGDAIEKMMRGAGEGSVGGAAAGAAVASIFSDAGGALAGGAVGFVVGGIGGAVGAGVGEVFDYGSHKLDQMRAKDKAANEQTAKDKEAKDKAAATTPPPKEEEKKEATPPPPPPAKEDKKDTPDPMRGSGRNYEQWREAYLGHADGTPFGARGTDKGSGSVDPRKTNPGRDQGEDGAPSESGQGPSINDLVLVADPSRGAKVDARAAQLMQGGRVTGRHILTDPDAENKQGGSVRPRGNGLT